MTERKFLYTVQAVIQEPSGNVFDLAVEFSGSVNIDESGYYLPWEITESGVADLMREKIISFLAQKSAELSIIIDYYNTHITYNVSTSDPFVIVQFVEQSSQNVHDPSPNIQAIISPEPVGLQSPNNFTGEYNETDKCIVWQWGLVSGCAYNIYDHEGNVVAQLGVDKNMFIEINIEAGKNYTRCVTAWNTNMESSPSPFVAITIPAATQVIDINSNLRAYQLNSPFVRHKQVIEQNIERLSAFHSGVGDNLDLLVQHTQEFIIKEEFDFNIHFQGTETVITQVATPCSLWFLTAAVGHYKQNIGIHTDWNLIVRPFPYYKASFGIRSYYYKPIGTDVQYDIVIEYFNPVLGQTKMNLTYLNTIMFDEPEANRLIVDFDEWIRNHKSMQGFGEYTLISLTESIVTSIFVESEIRDNKLYLSCTKSNTFWEFNQEYDIEIMPDDTGWMQLVDSSEIVPLNAWGDELPDGIIPRTLITYHNRSPYYGIYETYNDVLTYVEAFSVIVPGLRCFVGTIDEYAEVNYELTDEEPFGEQSVNDMLTTLIDSQMYMLKIDKLSATGNGRLSTSLGDAVQIGDSYYVKVFIKPGTYLRLDGEDDYSYTEWYEYSVGQEVQVNKNTIYQPGRARLKMIIPPEGVEDVYYMAMITSVSTVSGYTLMRPDDFEIILDSEYEPNKTRIMSDMATFRTTARQDVRVTRPWRGYSYKSHAHVIETPNPVAFVEQFLNPLYDGSQVDKDIFDVTMVVESNNPNVEVYCSQYQGAQINLASFNDVIGLEFTAKIIAPGQNAWSPLVHPGIYYINNDEYCLYADHQPWGEYTSQQVPEIREAYATMTAHVQLRTRELNFEKLLRTKEQFVGSGSIDGTIVNGTVITDDGRICLEQTEDSNGVVSYLLSGYYMSPWQTFDYTLSRLRVAWETIWSPDGRFGTVYAQVRYYSSLNADPSNWYPLDNDKFYVPERNIIAFQIRFNFEKELQIKPFRRSLVHKSVDQWLTGIADVSNISFTDNTIKSANPAGFAMYTSDIIECNMLETDKFEISIFANHSLAPGYEYELEVTTSNSYAEIETTPSWSTVNEGDVFQQRKYMRYRIKITNNSKTIIYSVNIDFQTENYRYEYAPEIRSLRLTGVPYEFDEFMQIYKTFVIKVPMNRRYNDVTEYNLRDMIHTELVQMGYYDYRLGGVTVSTIDENIRLAYDGSGGSKLRAMSLIARSHYANDTYLGISIDTGRGYLNPIPVAGRPVILRKDDYDNGRDGYFTQVTFLDKNNKTTLVNTEYITADGRNVLPLGYKGLDTSTLVVRQYESEQAMKGGVGGKRIYWQAVIDNFIYFIENLERGTFYEVTYKLKDSFAVDYNEFTDIGRATIMVHTYTGNSDYTKLRVWYEVQQHDAWYYANKVEINTLYNPIHQGFIFLTDYERTCSSVEVLRSPEMLLADGQESRYFFVRTLDEIGNPIGNIPVQINVLHGKLFTRSNISNLYGIICVHYTVPMEESMDTDTNDWTEILTVRVPDSNIYHEEQIRLYRPGSNRQIQVTTNQVTVSVGENINLDIKVFDDALQPIDDVEVTAYLHEFDTSDKTGPDGKCSLVIPAMVNHQNNYCRIRLTCGYQHKYMNIKVV